MLRWLIAPLVIAALALPAFPQGSELNGNETLFTVMAAINAAGYDADIESPTNYPLRTAVRQYIGSLKLNSVPKLKVFFAAHRQDNSTAELSQYIPSRST